MKIIILALKTSNWRSVNEALILSGLKSAILSPSEILKIPKYSICIIPGVGNIAALVTEFKDIIEIDDLAEFFKFKKIKIIGICLGFHFLCSRSFENIYSPCLNFFKETVEPIYSPPIPSVGWKNLLKKNDHTNQISDYLKNFLLSNQFYFTHSYGVSITERINTHNDYWYYLPKNAKMQIAAIFNENFIGFQFHPEKSGLHGIKLLDHSINYLNLRK